VTVFLTRFNAKSFLIIRYQQKLHKFYDKMSGIVTYFDLARFLQYCYNGILF